MTLAHSSHPEHVDLRFRACGEKFYIRDDNPEDFVTQCPFQSLLCFNEIHVLKSNILWRRVWRGEKWFLSGRTFYKPMHFDVFMYWFNVVFYFCNFYCEGVFGLLLLLLFFYSYWCLDSLP